MVFCINADHMKTPKTDLKSTCVSIHQYFLVFLISSSIARYGKDIDR